VERVLNRTHAAVWITSAGPGKGLPLLSFNGQPQGTFDPTSPLVSYQDDGTCGPRGDDAKADLRRCGAMGAEVVSSMSMVDYKIQTRVKGCGFFAWTIYRCRSDHRRRRSAQVLAASRIAPLRVLAPSLPEWSRVESTPVAAALTPRCSSFDPPKTRTTIILVGDLHFQKKYETQIQSMRCFADRHSYVLKILQGSEYKVCAKYMDYFFRKHCTVAEFLESQPPGLVAAVVDADVVAMTLERGLERWVQHDADVQLYDRCLLHEIMAGNYMVRNSPFARAFLRRWAKYNFEKPPGFSSSDNGAIHLVVMEMVHAQGLEKCKKLYRGLDRPVTDLDKYWIFVKCTKDALGPPRAWKMHDGSLTVWPRLSFYVSDGVYWQKIASDSVGPVMHHGIKDSKDVLHHYYEDVWHCRLNDANVRREPEELGKQAQQIGFGYKEFFERGKCKQCADVCLANFSCAPLGNDEAPFPKRTCKGNCL